MSFEQSGSVHSDPSRAPIGTETTSRRAVGCSLVALAVPALVLAFFGATYLVTAPGYLAFGWVAFLKRTLPEVTVSWPAVGMFAICSTCFVFGLDRFIRKARSHWRLAGTIRVTAALLLTLIVGFAGPSAAIHLGRLLTAGDKILVSNWDIGRRVRSQNNLKLHGLAVANASADGRGLIAGSLFDDAGRSLHGWSTLLLPYMDQTTLFEQIDLRKPWDDPANVPYTRLLMSDFVNPGMSEGPIDPDFGVTHYSANARLFGSTPNLAGETDLDVRSIPDGVANTILFGEITTQIPPWAKPGNWRDPAAGVNVDNGFGGPWRHRGCVFVFADGHAQFVSESTDPAVLEAFATPDGREAIDDF